MAYRLDHVVIAARDLEAASQRMRAMGFDVRAGGAHPGQGTQNAIIRFGLDYLELLAIANAQEAASGNLSGESLVAYLQAFTMGAAGYALATTTIEADAARLAAAGVAAVGPFAMRRQRPDGSQLAWRLLIPGGTPWRRPWPFLIQWETPDAERLQRERPGAHPNGVVGVTGVTVVVRDLDSALQFYERYLQLARSEARLDAAWAATGVAFQVGAATLTIVTPQGAGLASETVDAQGEGILALTLSAPDPDGASRSFAAAGVAVQQSEGRVTVAARALDLAPQPPLPRGEEEPES